jgi:hypothetical protein
MDSWRHINTPPVRSRTKGFIPAPGADRDARTVRTLDLDARRERNTYDIEVLRYLTTDNQSTKFNY